MNKPRKHAEVIKAWADGAQLEVKLPRMGWELVHGSPLFREDRGYRVYDPMREFKEAYARGEPVEFKTSGGRWCRVVNPNWAFPPDLEYRIAPKPDYKASGLAYTNSGNAGRACIKVVITFDGETNQPKSVELDK